MEPSVCCASAFPRRARIRIFRLPAPSSSPRSPRSSRDSPAAALTTLAELVACPSTRGRTSGLHFAHALFDPFHRRFTPRRYSAPFWYANAAERGHRSLRVGRGGRMRLRQRLLVSAVLVFGLLPRMAQATGILDLPGFIRAEVCNATPTLITCTGLSAAQLAAPGLHPIALADGSGPASFGIDPTNGLLALYLFGQANGGPYNISAVFLEFDSSQPTPYVAPSSVSFLQLRLGPNTTPADVTNRLLQPIAPDGPSLPPGVQILSGGLTFGFASVPEPTTAGLLSVGLVLLARRCNTIL
jgi:hypothetical protein